MHSFDKIILLIILFLILYTILVYIILKKRIKLKLNKQNFKKNKKKQKDEIKYSEPAEQNPQITKENNVDAVLELNKAPQKIEIIKPNLEKETLNAKINRMNQAIKDTANNTKVYEPILREDKKKQKDEIKYSELAEQNPQITKENNIDAILELNKVLQKVEVLKSNLEKECIKDSNSPHSNKNSKTTDTMKPVLMSDDTWELILDLRKNITGPLAGVDIDLLTEEQKLEFAKMGWREKICVFPDQDIDKWKLEVLKDERDYRYYKQTGIKPHEYSRPSMYIDKTSYLEQDKKQLNFCKEKVLISNLENETLKAKIDRMNQAVKDTACNTKVYDPIPRKKGSIKDSKSLKPLLISDDTWELILDLRKNITGALSGVNIDLLTEEQKLEFAKMGWREKICVFPDQDIDRWKLEVLKDERDYRYYKKTGIKPTRHYEPYKYDINPSYSYDHWVEGHWVTRNGTTYWRSGHSRRR
ncbi:MAG: hypothetical protein ACRCYT_08645 [Cetobacterium sp.]